VLRLSISLEQGNIMEKSTESFISSLVKQLCEQKDDTLTEKYATLLEICSRLTNQIQYNEILLEKIACCDKVTFHHGDGLFTIKSKNRGKVVKVQHANLATAIYDFISNSKDDGES
jgi:predicted house-cleaning noncanonical NTP pyrophosphatase (MazG superfamily)